LIQLFCW